MSILATVGAREIEEIIRKEIIIQDLKVLLDKNGNIVLEGLVGSWTAKKRAQEAVMQNFRYSSLTNNIRVQ